MGTSDVRTVFASYFQDLLADDVWNRSLLQSYHIRGCPILLSRAEAAQHLETLSLVELKAFCDTDPKRSRSQWMYTMFQARHQIDESQKLLLHLLRGEDAYEKFVSIVAEDSAKAFPPLYCQLLPLWFGRRGTTLSAGDYQELRAMTTSWFQRDHENLQVQQTTSLVRNMLSDAEITTQMVTDVSVLRIQTTVILTVVLGLLVLGTKCLYQLPRR